MSTRTVISPHYVSRKFFPDWLKEPIYMVEYEVAHTTGTGLGTTTWNAELLTQTEIDKLPKVVWKILPE